MRAGLPARAGMDRATVGAALVAAHADIYTHGPHPFTTIATWRWGMYVGPPGSPLRWSVSDPRTHTRPYPLRLIYPRTNDALLRDKIATNKRSKQHG
jgi:hypothetical protein